MERGVEDLQMAFAEIGDIQKTPGPKNRQIDRGDGCALVNRRTLGIYLDDGLRRIYVVVPSRYGSVFSYKKEGGRLILGNLKISAAVEDSARRRARGAAAEVAGRDRNYEWHNLARSVIESGESGPIVSHPPWTAGAARQPPGIDEIGIGDGRYA